MEQEAYLGWETSRAITLAFFPLSLSIILFKHTESHLSSMVMLMDVKLVISHINLIFFL